MSLGWKTLVPLPPPPPPPCITLVFWRYMMFLSLRVHDTLISVTCTLKLKNNGRVYCHHCNIIYFLGCQGGIC